MSTDPISAVADSLRKASQLSRRGRPTGSASAQPGARFGQWTVKSYTSSYMKDGKQMPAVCTCRCDCGTVRTVLAQSLQRGKSKSCGHETYGRPPR